MAPATRVGYDFAPHSLVTIKPDCYGIGIRMKLPNGGQVVMPLGRLSSTSTT